MPKTTVSTFYERPFAEDLISAKISHRKALASLEASKPQKLLSVGIFSTLAVASFVAGTPLFLFATGAATYHFIKKLGADDQQRQKLKAKTEILQQAEEMIQLEQKFFKEALRSENMQLLALFDEERVLSKLKGFGLLYPKHTELLRARCLVVLGGNLETKYFHAGRLKKPTAEYLTEEKLDILLNPQSQKAAALQEICQDVIDLNLIKTASQFEFEKSRTHKLKRLLQHYKTASNEQAFELTSSIISSTQKISYSKETASECFNRAIAALKHHQDRFDLAKASQMRPRKAVRLSIVPKN